MFLLCILFFSTGLWSAEQPAASAVLTQQQQETVDISTRDAQRYSIAQIKSLSTQPGQAAFILGIKWLKGYGLPRPNYEAALTYLATAAIQSPFVFFRPAQYYIDAMFEQNQLSDESIKKVLFEKKEPGLLQELAAGNIRAFTFLNYEFNNKYLKPELQKDIQVKITQTLKSAPDAVEKMYIHLMPENVKNTLYLLGQLEEKYENPYAALYLATLCDQGLYKYLKDIPVEKDLHEAFGHYKIAADAGIPQAEYAVAKAYFFQAGADADIPLALDYLQKALEKRYTPAIMLLGFMYFYGNANFQLDRAKAIAYFKQAAALNDPKAFFILGQMAFQGINDQGIQAEPDYQKALEYFDKSKHMGLVNANYFLAFFHKAGLYVPKDHKRAQELYAELINSGDPDTHAFKGELYERGIHLGQDLAKARQYYLDAFHNGDFFAQKFVRDLDAKIGRAAQAQPIVETPTESFEIPAVKKTKKQTSTKPTQEQVEYGRKKSAEKDFLLALNNKFDCSDQSVVTEVNFEDGYIRVFRESDKTQAMVTIDIEDKKRFKYVKKFKYQKRIQDQIAQLSDKSLTGASYNSMIRHAFPEMIDYIIQLFGEKLSNNNENTLLIDGTIIPGKYPQNLMVGFFAYGYNDKKKELDLYHRFLHLEKPTALTGS